MSGRVFLGVDWMEEGLLALRKLTHSGSSATYYCFSLSAVRGVSTIARISRHSSSDFDRDRKQLCRDSVLTYEHASVRTKVGRIWKFSNLVCLNSSNRGNGCTSHVRLNAAVGIQSPTSSEPMWELCSDSSVRSLDLLSISCSPDSHNRNIV